MQAYSDLDWLRSAEKDRLSVYIPSNFLRMGYLLKDAERLNSKLKDAMEYRHNIKFFDQKRIPTKEQIDKILTDSHIYVPHKNNLIGIQIKIYGPEYDKEKENLVLATLCGPGRSLYKDRSGKYYGNTEELRKRYYEWREIQINGMKGLDDYRKKHGLNFNEQVRAPYLLAFSRKIRLPTPSQEKRGFQKWVYDNSLSENLDYKWYLGAGIHAYGIALLSAEQGMYSSFCRCFTKLPNIYSKCLEEMYKNDGKESDVFYLGIGFRDMNVKYYVDKNKATKDEYMTWM
jgi:hypothetical protein